MSTSNDRCNPLVSAIGDQLQATRLAYRKWLGESYDLVVLDSMLCAAAGEKLEGDPAWLNLIGGPGAAKTETIMPLAAATEGRHVISTISGEAAFLSGTSKKEIAEDATGGILRAIGDSGMLVIKDMTSILGMNRDTRNLILDALREIYDGHWTRTMGTDGGKVLTWQGRVIVIAACTTAWDAHHHVISKMGDRFMLVRLTADADERKAARRKAMRNVGQEKAMREDLKDNVGTLLGMISGEGSFFLSDDEEEGIGELADLITRTRTAVERDGIGNPMFAHEAEMPTRLSKQLIQLGRGGLALGMNRADVMQVICRVAADTMPPFRLRLLAYVADNPQTGTSAAVKALQLPRTTVDRTLQELHLLGLLVVEDQPFGEKTRWVYSVAGDVNTDALMALAGRTGKLPVPPSDFSGELRVVAGPPAGSPGMSEPTVGTSPGMSEPPVSECATCHEPMTVIEPGQTTHPGCDDTDNVFPLFGESA